MSSWRECGHEAFGSETECLRCRIDELEDVLKNKNGITVVKLSAGLMCADIGNIQNRMVKAEAKLDAVDVIVSRLETLPQDTLYSRGIAYEFRSAIRPADRVMGEQKYFSMTGKEISLLALIREEPEWAKTHINELEAERKTDCINFFRWFWNQPGTNAEQGYDKWLALQQEQSDE